MFSIISSYDLGIFDQIKGGNGSDQMGGAVADTVADQMGELL